MTVVTAAARSAWTGEGGPRRILIVRVGAMGDVLHALPAVTALAQALPEASIAWAVDARWAPLLFADAAAACRPGGWVGAAGTGEDQAVGRGLEPRVGTRGEREVKARDEVVDRLFCVPTQAWKRAPVSGATVRSVAELYRGLQGAMFDVAIDLQGTLRSGFIAGMSGAERRVGPARPREGAARLFYNEEAQTRAVHVVEQAAEIVSVGVGRRIAPAAEVSLPRDAAAEAWATKELRDVAEGYPIVVLAPTAGWGAKMWPAVRFGELARRLADEGAAVLVSTRRVQSPVAGDPVAAEVVRASGGAARPVVSSLPELVALLRRAAVVVAGDTGPMHLAAALGRPLVALFGPTDPQRNGPWTVAGRGEGARFAVLRDPSSATDHTRSAEPDPGLLRIGVETVFREARGLLDRWSVRKPDPRARGSQVLRDDLTS